MRTFFQIITLFCVVLLVAAQSARAQGNMRREGALSLNQTSDDKRGFYGTAIDPTNGFAYFGSRYVYKVNIAGPLPVQVGAGVSLAGGQPFSGTMDIPAGCAYFGVNSSIYQIMANGTNAPSLGSVMTSPFGSSTFCSTLLIDTSDPSAHYLYVMTTTANTSSTLYKINLNLFPGTNAIVGWASTTAQQPALGYGVIDLTNRCAYYGSFIATTQPPYVAKFLLGSGANPPINVGGVSLDAATNRCVGGFGLDIANGYGYCASDGTDVLFGHGRVYKWALNGTNAPTLVSWVDMHTNEGYAHVCMIKPDRGLLYFSSDLSYPAFVYRFRLQAGTNAPVETDPMPLLAPPTTNVPAWGTNPGTVTNWGEVFARSLAYDPVHDFTYIGRDCADAQIQPYSNQIVKVALDREEALLALTESGAITNHAIPYRESFESYTNGASVLGSNGWSGEDSGMGIVTNTSDTYSNIFPIFGPHSLLLQVDGAVTNSFATSTNTKVWVDMVMQAKYWTDPIMPILSNNVPFALCVTTNGHLAVWNRTNAPASGNGWTVLPDTSIASNQFFRVCIEANYNRDTNGEFYFRVWVNGVPSTNPQTWYASADTNQNYFGGLLAEGHFQMDDLVVSVPALSILNITRSANGNVNLSCFGMPGIAQRVMAATTLNSPVNWQFISTNTAGADGTFPFTDINSANTPQRFYQTSLP